MKSSSQAREDATISRVELADELARIYNSAEDLEIAAVDSQTGECYLFTVKDEHLFCAPFLMALEAINDFEQGQPAEVSISANRYKIEASFRPKFINEIRAAEKMDSHQLSIRTITVQSPMGVCCHLGVGDLLIEGVVCKLPKSLVFQEDTIRRVSRDVGRKIGWAAKDLALFRGKQITLQMLSDYELSGEEMAWKLVNKDAILPNQSFDDLRQMFSSPIVAWIFWQARRRLLVRPARGQKFRQLYVDALSKLRDQLVRCASRQEAAEVMTGTIECMEGLERQVLGASFCKFCRYMRGRYLISTFRVLKQIEESPTEEAWSRVRRLTEDCGSPSATGRGQVLPLPQRPPRKLDELRRVGRATTGGTHQDLMIRYGFTGIELGNWVRKADMDALVSWIDSASFDFTRVTGDWIVALARAGNLALAIGARGSGGASAHYEPALKTINLTRTHSQGSLGHELAHFIDHQFGILYGRGEKTPFLSDAIAAGLTGGGPLVNAFRQVLGEIGLAQRWHELTGNPEPRRWFRSSFVLNTYRKCNHDVQRTYECVTEMDSERPQARARSESTFQMAADSIAKWTKQEVKVRSFHKATTSYLREAKKLGIYWSRPHELFARAFESWIEDQLTANGQCNEYLVSGTQRDYQHCRGLPYPVGHERQAIGGAISSLMMAHCHSVQSL